MALMLARQPLECRIIENAPSHKSNTGLHNCESSDGQANLDIANGRDFILQSALIDSVCGGILE